MLNSDCSMPMIIPPANVSGNERRPPINAAAITVTVRTVPVSSDTPMIGASNTPANPDSAPATAQLIAPTTLIGQPKAASVRGLSDTAVVAKPNVVRV
jgi:hypothetical protein